MSLITAANLATQPIQEGDAGLILRKDGNFHIFNCHATIDVDNLTPRQIEQVEILQAFAVALKHPQVMEVLKTMSNDPRIVGDSVLDVGTQH